MASKASSILALKRAREHQFSQLGSSSPDLNAVSTPHSAPPDIPSPDKPDPDQTADAIGNIIARTENQLSASLLVSSDDDGWDDDNYSDPDDVVPWQTSTLDSDTLPQPPSISITTSEAPAPDTTIPPAPPAPHNFVFFQTGHFLHTLEANAENVFGTRRGHCTAPRHVHQQQGLGGGSSSDPALNVSSTKAQEWCPCMHYHEPTSGEGGKCANCGHYPTQHEEIRFGSENVLQLDLQTSKWSINYQDLDFDQALGHGSFGIVYKGRWRFLEQPVAIKKMLMSDDPDDRNEAALWNFQQEVSVLSHLRHPSLLSLIGYSIKPKRRLISPTGEHYTQPKEYCIVTELCERGDLRQLIRYENNHGNGFPATRLIQFSIDIARGMGYLHEIELIHCDLKLENIFVCADYSCRVADLGLAVEAGMTCDEPIGTLPYCPPEMVLGRSNRISFAVDIYAYGICLWELFHQQTAHENVPREGFTAIAQRKERPPISEDYRAYLPELVTLIESAWHEDPVERPSFDEILIDLRKIQKKIANVRPAIQS